MKSILCLTTLILSFYPFLILAQPPSSDYKLLFFDHFNDEQIDENIWWRTNCTSQGTPENGCQGDFWYKPENTTESEGLLTITALDEPTYCNDILKPYTSGHIQTAAEFKYGYYEIKAKVPEGNGFWPAFWFWSGNNNAFGDYHEIDVFEFCGCDCTNYKAGHFYETDGDGIVNNQTIQTANDIDLTNNACENFNVYGVEWTPTHLRFFLNGIEVSSSENKNNHSPMAIILNLAVGGCYGGCGWELCKDPCKVVYKSNCKVTCGTKFPATFEIDWIKGYQKENQSLFTKGPDEICINSTSTYRAPVYPNATYKWTGSKGIVVNQSRWLDTKVGLWRTATVNAVTPGLQTLTLTITFQNGYVETRYYHIVVRDEAPETPSKISINEHEFECYYELSINPVPGASSYNWVIFGKTYTTTNSFITECVDWGSSEISVTAQNECGQSPTFTGRYLLPQLDCFQYPQKLAITLNPSSRYLNLKLFDIQKNEVIEIKGNLMITDKLGTPIIKKSIDGKIKKISKRRFEPGLYYVIFQNSDVQLSTTFIKD